MNHGVLVAISLVAIAFGFGGRFYWAKRTSYLHDTWYHLLASDVVRDNGHRLPDSIEQFIFQGPYDYPPLLHWALSFLPERWVHRHNWIVAPIADLLHGCVLLFPTTYLLTGRPEAGVVAVAIYAITPELFRHFTGLSPRSVGSLFFSVIFLLMLLGIQGSPGLFVPAIVLGGILLLTHKMSSQALAFLSIGFSILEGDLTYVLVFLGMVVAALVLSLGHYVKVFRSHVAIINFWRIQRAKGNPPNAFRRDLGREPESYDESLLGRAKRIVTGIDPLWVFLSNPWTIFFPIPLLLYRETLQFSTFESKILAWALVILGIAIATQYVPKLKLVGEGYKYFLWGTFPAALILGKLAVELPPIPLYAAMGLLAVMSVTFIYFMMQARVRSEHTSDIASANEIVSLLRDSGIERIMCVPPTGSYPLAFLTRKKILWHDSTTAFEEGEIYYPTPQASLEEIAEEYDIDAIVVDKLKVRVDESYFDTYTPKIDDGDHLLLVKISGTSA